jgi:hypothetical protein
VQSPIGPLPTGLALKKNLVYDPLKLQRIYDEDDSEDEELRPVPLQYGAGGVTFKFQLLV